MCVSFGASIESVKLERDYWCGGRGWGGSKGSWRKDLDGGEIVECRRHERGIEDNGEGGLKGESHGKVGRGVH